MTGAAEKLTGDEIIEWVKAEDIAQSLANAEAPLDRRDADLMVERVINDRINRVQTALGTVLAARCYEASVRTFRARTQEEPWVRLREQAIGQSAASDGYKGTHRPRSSMDKTTPS